MRSVPRRLRAPGVSPAMAAFWTSRVCAPWRRCIFQIKARGVAAPYLCTQSLTAQFPERTTHEDLNEIEDWTDRADRRSTRVRGSGPTTSTYSILTTGVYAG